MPPKWTAAEMKRRICTRHPLAKGWFTQTEFCPESGSSGAAGRMDAVAVCLYTSRDFAVHGFEVKVQRSDWLSELNNPGKNGLGIAQVDYWWIVAPSTEIVKAGELPAKWGLYTCSGRGLRATKQAERLKDEMVGFSRGFVVSLLWKVAHFRTPGEEALEAAHEAGKQEERKERAEHAFDWDEFDVKRLAELQKLVDQFEERSGIALNEYSLGKIGGVVRALQDLEGGKRMRRELEYGLKAVREVAGNIEKGLAQLVEKEAGDG